MLVLYNLKFYYKKTCICFAKKKIVFVLWLKNKKLNSNSITAHDPTHNCTCILLIPCDVIEPNMFESTVGKPSESTFF